MTGTTSGPNGDYTTGLVAAGPYRIRVSVPASRSLALRPRARTGAQLALGGFAIVIVVRVVLAGSHA